MNLSLALAVISSVVTAAQIEDPRKAQLNSVQFGFAGPLFSEPSIGWGLREGRSNWVTAVVHNPLDREFQAAVAFRTAITGASGQFNVRKSFRMPAQADMRVAFPVSYPSLAGQIEPKIHFEIELFADGESHDMVRATAGLIADNVHPLALVGDEVGLRYTLQNSIVYPNRGPELQMPSVIRTVTLRQDSVPDDALGLDFFDTIIYVHPEKNPLRELQWAAIARWVESGGRLVFVVGPEASNSPQVDELLPVQVIGERHVTVLPALSEWSGEQFKLPKPLRVTESQVRRGDVLLWDGHNPLIVRGRYGLGSVTYVAVEQLGELAISPGPRKFWTRLLAELDEPPPVDLARMEPQVNPLIEQFVGRPVVGVWLPVVVIVGYFITLAITLQARASLTSERARWSAISVASLLFAVGTLGLGWWLSPQTQERIYQLWLAYGRSDARSTRVASYMSVVPTSRGPATLTLTGDSVRIEPRVEQGANVVVSDVKPNESMVQFQAEKGRTRTFSIKGSLPAETVQVIGEARKSGIQFRITNRFGVDLEDCFIKLGRRFEPAGDIGRGDERSLEMGPGTPADLVPTINFGGGHAATNRLRQTLLQTLFVDPSALRDHQPMARIYRGVRQGTSSGAVFVGWSDESLLTASLGDDSTSPAGLMRSLGLVSVVPEIHVAEDEFLIPQGTMTLELPDTAVGQYYFGRSAFRADRPVSSTALTLRYTLPGWARPAELLEAKLFIQFVAEAYRLRVHVGETALQLPELPYGGYSIPTTLLKDRDSLELRLEVEAREQFADKGWQDYQWFIRGVELECVGRRIHDDRLTSLQPPGQDKHR